MRTRPFHRPPPNIPPIPSILSIHAKTKPKSDTGPLPSTPGVPYTEIQQANKQSNRAHAHCQGFGPSGHPVSKKSHTRVQYCHACVTPHQRGRNNPSVSHSAPCCVVGRSIRTPPPQATENTGQNLHAYQPGRTLTTARNPGNQPTASNLHSPVAIACPINPKSCPSCPSM